MNYIKAAAGATSVSVNLEIFDSTTFLQKTDAVFNSSGIDLKYRREGAAVTSITEVTLAALTTAWTSGGFLHIANGTYRLDIPDAAVATGVSGCWVGGAITGGIILPTYVQLIASTEAEIGVAVQNSTDTDAVALKTRLTRIPNIALGSTGALPQVNSDLRVAASVKDIVTDAITAASVKTDAVTEIQTGLATSTALTSVADAVTAIGAKTTNLPAAPADQTNLAAAIASVQTAVNAVKTKSDQLTFTVAGNVDANVQLVNEASVGGDGEPGTEWGPA